MSEFASGKLAHGFCDRCGFRYPLDELRTEYDTGISLNNRICPTCWDSDHPQNFLHTVEADDAIALKDPRPDASLTSSRALGVKVGQINRPMTSPARAKVGTVTVVTT